MPAISSSMLALGTPAPEFSLPDVVTGRTVSLQQFVGKRGLLVMFLSAHCPFVQHVESELARIGHDYAANGLGIVGIGSNDAVTYPEDGPPGLKAQAQRNSFAFPYLYDESQETAQAFQAACTPDFFLFDSAIKLVYRGQLDGSRPNNGVPLDGRDLRAALDALMENKPVPREQQPSIGCDIKWKKVPA